jgi:hypothetical protein
MRGDRTDQGDRGLVAAVGNVRGKLGVGGGTVGGREIR